MKPATLTPVDGTRAVVYGAGQPQYDPLPGLLLDDGVFLTEWELTEEERARVLAGERIRLWVWTHGQPLQPVALEITDEHRP